MDGDDQTDASWRRVLEAVDAQAAAESTTNDNASSGTGALEFSLRFRFEGFPLLSAPRCQPPGVLVRGRPWIILGVVTPRKTCLS